MDITLVMPTMDTMDTHMPTTVMPTMERDLLMLSQVLMLMPTTDTMVMEPTLVMPTMDTMDTHMPTTVTTMARDPLMLSPPWLCPPWILWIPICPPRLLLWLWTSPWLCPPWILWIPICPPRLCLLWKEIC